MNSLIINEKYGSQKEFHYFLCSDCHFGNKGQDRRALKADFDRARELNARIFINGDWGEFIMSGDMKRYSPSVDAYGTDNNINMTIDEAFDFFSDYVDLIAMIGTGNHEVSVSKFHHFDPTQQLIYSLNKKHGTHIAHGQYSGFVTMRFRHNKGGTRTFKIFYNHGQGTTAEITKGTIDINRHMASKNADLIWLGHKHTKLLLPCENILDVDNSGRIFSRERAGLITGAYLNVFSQYDAMKKGYRIMYGEEKMRGLQSTGGAFMKISIVNQKIQRRFEL